MFLCFYNLPGFFQPDTSEDTSGFRTVGGFGWVILDLAGLILDQQCVTRGVEGAANGNIDEPTDAVIDQRRN